MSSFGALFDPTVLLLIFGSLTACIVPFPKRGIVSAAMLLVAGISTVAVGYISLTESGGLRPNNMFTLFFLWAVVGAHTVGASQSPREGAWDAITVLLANFSASLDNVTLRMVVLQLAYLCCFMGPMRSREGGPNRAMPFMAVTVLSTLALTAGSLLEDMFRTRMDEVGLARAAVSAAVIGYALRLGLPPLHVWLRPYPDTGRGAAWFLALAPAAAGLLISYAEGSVSWTSQVMALQEMLVALPLVSATIAFLLSLAYQGTPKNFLIATGLWSLPVAVLPLSLQGITLAVGMGFFATVLGFSLVATANTGVRALFTMPVYPLLPGVGTLILFGGLATSPVNLALTIGALACYAIAVSSSRELSLSFTTREAVLALLMGGSGIALPWLLTLVVVNRP